MEEFPNQPIVIPVLAAPLGDQLTDTSFTVDSWTYEAAHTTGNFRVRIDNEIIYVPAGGRTGNVFTGVTRNAELPSGLSEHLAGARVRCVGTRAGLQSIESSPKTEDGLILSDVTTNNATTTKHGFLHKLSGNATEFLNGLGVWAVPAGGGGGGAGAMEKISEVIVGVGGAATIDFSGIPATYRNLQLMIMGRGTQAATSVAYYLRMNGDSGANYDVERVGGFASTVNATGLAAQTQLQVGYLSGNSAPAGAASQASIFIYDYARAVWQKAVTSTSGLKSVTTTSNEQHNFAGWWRNTAVITQLTLHCAAGNFVEGTVATLYGLT